MADRFFLGVPFQKEAKVKLDGQEFHHLAHVMRVACKEIVELINGKNQLAIARVESLSKKEAELLLLSVSEEEKKVPLILAAALFKFARLEWLIEKAVELGATEIRLFPAHRSEKKSLSPSQQSRFGQIALSALKQCKRLDLPPIHFYPTLENLPLDGTPYFGDLRKDALPFLKPGLPLIFITGPEGGLTDEEIHLLEGRGARGIRLHSNILRAETAGVAALTLCTALLP